MTGGEHYNWPMRWPNLIDYLSSVSNLMLISTGSTVVCCHSDYLFCFPFVTSTSSILFDIISEPCYGTLATPPSTDKNYLMQKHLFLFFVFRQIFQRFASHSDVNQSMFCKCFLWLSQNISFIKATRFETQKPVINMAAVAFVCCSHFLFSFFFFNLWLYFKV